MLTVGPADHPRACGENRPVRVEKSGGAGSSPRVRGKRGAGVADRPRERIIPARAGKTSATASTGGSPPDHPRACGENATAAWTGVQAAGSSPRVRGKQAPCGSGEHPPRIIPARAGKTKTSRSCRSPAWDHPRACGENTSRISRMSAPAGSSPRVRGKQARERNPVLLDGIIPARAGKTARRVPPRPRRPDHPRACGENAHYRRPQGRSRGSSPRVRGKHGSSPPSSSARGIIPARAGKTGDR